MCHIGGGYMCHCRQAQSRKSTAAALCFSAFFKFFLGSCLRAKPQVHWSWHCVLSICRS